MKDQFTAEQIQAAKQTRDAIIAGDVNELKSVYMAGEIVMWDELRTEFESLNEQLDNIVHKTRNECQKTMNENTKLMLAEIENRDAQLAETNNKLKETEQYLEEMTKLKDDWYNKYYELTNKQ